ncbi:MAG: hypothetical protein R3F13_09980 [Prosthecobacter sp.]
MKALSSARNAGLSVCASLFVWTAPSIAQVQGGCFDIAADVQVAVEKDPSKVLMVVEDALVINESCASDIVKAAILASKADATLASQIVQTAVSVAPKMAAAINSAAAIAAPGIAVATPTEEAISPDLVIDKNPGKNPVIPPAPAVEEDFFVPASIRGVYLIQPPASGPLPCDPTNRNCNPNPVSPSVATS